jgi:hypothetical protein
MGICAGQAGYWELPDGTRAARVDGGASLRAGTRRPLLSVVAVTVTL